MDLCYIATSGAYHHQQIPLYLFFFEAFPSALLLPLLQLRFQLRLQLLRIAI